MVDFEILKGDLNKLYLAKKAVDEQLKQLPDGFVNDPFSAGDCSEEIFELGYLLHDVGINL